MALNYGLVEGNFTTFSDDEKLNYALKIALQRLQTDLAVDWFREPKDYIPKLPSEVYKNKIPEYSNVKNYFLIDPNIGDGSECVTNVTVEDILTFTSNGTHFTLEDVEDTEKVRDNNLHNNLNDDDFVDGSTRKQIKKLSRNMFTRYNYWQKGITGMDSPTLDNISTGTQPSGSTNSGTKNDKKEPENAIITYENGSLAGNRTFANMNAKRNKVLSDNAIGISIISPENKDDLTKRHPFLKLYLQVPLYTTRTAKPISESFSGGGENTDNIGFHNPVLSKSLGDVNGYLYSIVGWGSSEWTSVTTAYGTAGYQNILYFLNNPGFILIYGVKNIVYDFLTSQKYPPMMSFLRYEGETFEDGIITQAPATDLPPPEVANDKQLFIDTTNDIIYRFDGVLNEWKSIGGGGGGGDTSNLAKLDVSNTFLDDQLVKGKITAEGGFVNLSDMRVKSNIETIDSASSKLMQLRGVYYDMRGTRHLGLVAQELKYIIPEAVFEMNNGYYGVEYGNLVGLLIEGFKEQEERLREVERKMGEVGEKGQ